MIDHSRSSRKSTLASVTSLRMTAVTATLRTLPLSIGRSWKFFVSGLNPDHGGRGHLENIARKHATALMYLCPFRLPLSSGYSAGPAGGGAPVDGAEFRDLDISEAAVISPKPLIRFCPRNQSQDFSPS